MLATEQAAAAATANIKSRLPLLLSSLPLFTTTFLEVTFETLAMTTPRTVVDGWLVVASATAELPRNEDVIVTEAILVEFGDWGLDKFGEGWVVAGWKNEGVQK